MVDTKAYSEGSLQLKGNVYAYRNFRRGLKWAVPSKYVEV